MKWPLFQGRIQFLWTRVVQRLWCRCGVQGSWRAEASRLETAVMGRGWGAILEDSTGILGVDPVSFVCCGDRFSKLAWLLTVSFKPQHTLQWSRQGLEGEFLDQRIIHIHWSTVLDPRLLFIFIHYSCRVDFMLHANWNVTSALFQFCLDRRSFASSIVLLLLYISVSGYCSYIHTRNKRTLPR